MTVGHLDNSDINAGVAAGKQWVRVKLHPSVPDAHAAELYRTSIKFTGPKWAPSVAGLLQQQMSPAGGIVRYSTRVSLFTGEGSQKHSGVQEAGIVLLAEATGPSEFNSTFVGVRFDENRLRPKGSLIYSVGDGRKKYRNKTEVSDTVLPFRITEGEFEIVVEHDVAKNVLRRIQINGFDVTDRWSMQDRTQRISRGLFGLRSAIQNTNPWVHLQQFYWSYRVEALEPITFGESFARASSAAARPRAR